MTEEVAARILVNQDMIPSCDFLVDGEGAQIPQFHLTEWDREANYYDGISRSMILIKSFKRFFRENRDRHFIDLIDVPFTQYELKVWRKALPETEDSVIASWKRWGITPETAGFFHGQGVRTGHSAYDLSQAGYIDLDYLWLVRTWIITGATAFQVKKWGPKAFKAYKATYPALVRARELFKEDGHDLTDDELMDYIGLAYKDDGDSETLPTIRVPAVLAFSMKRNGVPPEYMMWAWDCGFRSYTEQVRLIDAHMQGFVTTEKLQAYHRLVEKGRRDELPDFIEMAKSGVPFEYLELVI